MRVLVTGSCGLVGSEAAEFYARRGHEVMGVDNNARKKYFGKTGDTGKMKQRLLGFSNYIHASLDVASKKAGEVVKEFQPELIVHCAGQPSHDYAAKNQMEDFAANATGTLNLLCACPRSSTFVFMSTNKVYGDAPNTIKVRELPTRYEYEDCGGVDETMTVDQSTHSFFGVSKLYADLVVQEYGRNFGMNTACFRAGCITGKRHAGAAEHGFLSYMANTQKDYTIYGYNGKQLRDQIHSKDMVAAIDAFRKNPKPAAVYNIGGGKKNTISVMEAVGIFGVDYKYVDTPRVGDHRCYYSDTTKFENDYSWKIKHTINDIIEELAKGE